MTVTDQHSAGRDSAHGVQPIPGVDPEEEPSAEWGWHGTPQRAGKIAGWFTAFALFAMLIGNNEGHVGDFFLIAPGAILVVMLIASHFKARKAKRR
ncbi:MAG: hypothetical protein QOJ06_82 [Pseudonocardiales bacterium]|nr:hypothetical protein [Pseudonocardiales bacterium]